MSGVALVYNVDRGTGQTRDAEYDLPGTIDQIKSYIDEVHECRLFEAVQDMSWIPQLLAYDPDVVFNIAEGYNGAAREAVYPSIFEQLDLPYCGPDPTNLLITLNKHLTKTLVAGMVDLNIPESQVYRSGFDSSSLENTGRYILKLLHEGSSIGMQLVDDPNKIPQLAEAMQATHKSIVLIEEYVDGADMAMAYVEGIGPMGPALITLPDEDFYNYDLKSRRDEEVEIVPYDAPPSLRRKINRVTEALVHRLDLKGYAKIDYRVHGNTINLVEVNSQVSFHPEGEFATCCKASGYELKDVIQAIVETGLHAQRLPSAGVQL